MIWNFLARISKQRFDHWETPSRELEAAFPNAWTCSRKLIAVLVGRRDLDDRGAIAIRIDFVLADRHS